MALKRQFIKDISGNYTTSESDLRFEISRKMSLKY